MENKVNELLENLYESIGYWTTDNNKINTDNMMIWTEENTLNIVDCDNDEEVHVKFIDIVDVVFNKLGDMIISIIKFKNRPTLLIHSFIN